MPTVFVGEDGDITQKTPFKLAAIAWVGPMLILERVETQIEISIARRTLPPGTKKHLADDQTCVTLADTGPQECAESFYDLVEKYGWLVRASEMIELKFPELLLGATE